MSLVAAKKLESCLLPTRKGALLLVFVPGQKPIVCRHLKIIRTATYPMLQQACSDPDIPDAALRVAGLEPLVKPGIAFTGITT